MGDGLKDMIHDTGVNDIDDHGNESSDKSSSSFYGDSDDSMFSSSLDITSDASSSPENSCNILEGELNSRGSIFEFTTLMEELPIKRGLSKYYQGKSQSFTLLSEARCIQDIVKKQISTPYMKRKITSRSYAGGLDKTQNNKPLFAPGPYSKSIAKKSSRNAQHGSDLLARRISSNPLLSCTKPPLIPKHKNLSQVK